MALSLGLGCSLLLDSAGDPCAVEQGCTTPASPSIPAAAAPDAGERCSEPCPDDAKQCDTRDGRCVQCTIDAHCASRHCDTEARRCLECRQNADCAQHEGRALCDGDRFGCVQCLSDTDCPSGESCTVDRTCVGCIAQRDCSDAARPRCELRSATCSPCKADSDCAHIEDRHICLLPQGECVQCTIEQEDVCGKMVCNDEHRCTNLERGGRRVCEACRFDSECLGGDRPLAQRDHRCVPLHYKGSPRGHYCLQLADRPCKRPHAVVTAELASISGAPAAAYCGIDQTLTTCEAVGHGGDERQQCSEDSNPQCGAPDVPDDGVCLTMDRENDFLCTYKCTAHDQCPEDTFCAPDMYCQ